MDWLLIKNWPPSLNELDINQFLSVFNFKTIRVIYLNQQIQHVLIELFHPLCAVEAFQRLHQYPILGHRLTVEYFDPSDQKNLMDDSEYISMQSVQQNLETTENAHKISYKPHLAGIPQLNWKTLMNITKSIALYPELYVNVLQLMRSMNLPSPVHFDCPSYGIYYQHANCTKTVQTDDLRSQNDEKLGMESPIWENMAETHQRDVISKITQNSTFKNNQSVFKLTDSTENEFKRLQEIFSLKWKKDPAITQKKSMQELFSSILGDCERFQALTTQRNQDFSSNVEPIPKMNSLFKDVSDHESEAHLCNSFPSSCFNVDDPIAGLSLHHIRENRISANEYHLHPAFNDYAPGEPCHRIYVKNLAKQVSDREITELFYTFVKECSGNELQMFYVQLMTRGRMRRQAFVGFPSDAIADQALRETNGYVLAGKPIVVKFARSKKLTSDEE